MSDYPERISGRRFKNNLQKIIFASFLFLLVIVVLVVGYTVIRIAQPVLIKNQQQMVELLGNRIVADLSGPITAAKTIAVSMASLYTGMPEKDASMIKRMVPHLFNLQRKFSLIAGGGSGRNPTFLIKIVGCVVSSGGVKLTISCIILMATTIPPALDIIMKNGMCQPVMNGIRRQYGLNLMLILIPFSRWLPVRLPCVNRENLLESAP